MKERLSKYWILKSIDKGIEKYLSYVEYTGKEFIFKFTDNIDDALVYKALIRAKDDCKFFNNRGDAYNHVKISMNKAIGRSMKFEVIQIGE